MLTDLNNRALEQLANARALIERLSLLPHNAQGLAREWLSLNPDLHIKPFSRPKVFIADGERK